MLNLLQGGSSSQLSLLHEQRRGGKKFNLPPWRLSLSRDVSSFCPGTSFLPLGWSCCSWNGAPGTLLGSPGSRCRGEERPKAGPAAEPRKLMAQMTFLLRLFSRGGSSSQSAETEQSTTKSKSSVSCPYALCLCITGLWSSTGCLSLGHCKETLPSIYIFKPHSTPAQ